MDTEKMIGEKCQVLSDRLNEATLRIWLATEAQALGRGGVSTAARATGVSRTTIHAGLKELRSPEVRIPLKSATDSGVKAAT